MWPCSNSYRSPPRGPKQGYPGRQYLGPQLFPWNTLREGRGSPHIPAALGSSLGGQHWWFVYPLISFKFVGCHNSMTPLNVVIRIFEEGFCLHASIKGCCSLSSPPPRLCAPESLPRDFPQIQAPFSLCGTRPQHCNTARSRSPPISLVPSAREPASLGCCCPKKRSSEISVTRRRVVG